MEWLLPRILSLRPRSEEGLRGRALVVSTPRSGNTWLRLLLAKVYGIYSSRYGQLWAHSPEGFPWEELPRQCVLQLHWEPDEPFKRFSRTRSPDHYPGASPARRPDLDPAVFPAH